MKNRYLLPLLTGIMLSVSLSAQPWMRLIPPEKKAHPEFSDIRMAFEKFWENRKIEKGKGWKQFKRWEDFMLPRSHQQHFDPMATWEALQSGHGSQKSLNGTWTPLGPTETPNDLYGNPSGSGRVNCIAFHPTNANTFWVGCPSGGIWKTTDGGLTWNTTTDQLSSIGISDLAVHPTNPDILFAATGDGDGYDTYSIGVIKSTDGGATWTATNLVLDVSQTISCRRILIHPTNPDILLLASGQGVYRSSNGGNSWQVSISGNFKDIEFKPGNPSVVYATSFGYTGADLYKSTNTGESFSVLSVSGWSSPDIFRAEIAVTAANPEVVYVAASNSSDDGLYGIFKSTNSGTTFSQVFSGTTLNLLGWQSDGSDSGGQGWYDLTLSASPTNQNTLFIGGVNLWRSTNGGSSWSIKGHWYGDGAAYVHADHHYSAFQPGTNQLFSCNDGGVYKSTDNGNNWTDLSSGLQILQIYRLGASASNSDLILAGSQDNGTMRKLGTSFSQILGGDGMECMVHPTNSLIVYATLYYGSIFRSTAGGDNFNDITPPGAEGAWVTPFVMHPTNSETLYAGYSDVYKTTNSGTSWSAISSNLTGGGKINALAIARSNPLYLYASSSGSIFRTTNGGSSWSEITSNLPSGYITSICIHPTNPNRVWVSFSGYTAGNKVFGTTNGGTTWTNLSGTLPNVPANCLVYELNSQDGIYVGTDIGVFYTNSLLTDWIDFSSGLPNVIVNELEIHYSTSRIRAATFGRGLWESDLCAVNQAPPVVAFQASQTTCLTGSTIQFTDQSSGNPTNWAWVFPGGTPASSGQQNPSIQYNSEGVYNVSLTATNPYGSNSLTQTALIHVQTGLADLTLQNTLVNPLAIPPATGFNISTSLANTGNYASLDCHLKVWLSTDTQVSADDSLLWDESVPPIGASLQANLAKTINPLNRAGIHYLLFEADAGGQVLESNEINNSFGQQINFVHPDLKMQSPSVTPFSNVLPGAQIQVTCQIVNQGSMDAPPSQFSLYFSANSQWSGTDPVLVNISVPAILSQATQNLSTSLLLPINLQDGTYYLHFKADSPNSLDESDESNNLITKFINIALPNPDLRFTAFYSDSSQIQTTETMTVHYTVQNLGPIGSPGTSMKFVLSNDPVYDEGIDQFLILTPLASLAPQTIFTGSIQITIPSNITPGGWNLFGILDPFATITEVNEENNMAVIFLDIQIGLPDLAISDFSISSASILQGMPLAMQCKVTNQGLAPAPAHDVWFYVSTTPETDPTAVPIGARPVFSLISSGFSWESLTWEVPSSLPDGQYYICFKADPQNLVSEVNESNNFGNLPLTVGTLSQTDGQTPEIQFLFPNPAQDFLQVNLGLTRSGRLEITDILGRKLYSESIDSETNTLIIPLTGFQKGFYLLRIISPEGDSTRSFLKD